MPGDWPPEQLERVDACPACGSSERAPAHAGLSDRLLDTPGRWDLWRCLACGSQFLDPRPTTDSIGRAYGERYMTHEAPVDDAPRGAVGELRRRLLHGYLNARFGYRLPDGLGAGRFLIPLLPEGRVRTERYVRALQLAGEHRLLDVGCGNGAFVAQMLALGWRAEGIDVDRRALAEGQAAGLPLREATVADLRPGDGRFDAVTLGHVIEHLHDPRATLERIRELLRPGGALWLSTPNVEAAGHRAFGPAWFALDPPRHLVLFSSAGLRQLLREAGFEAVQQRRPPAGARWNFPPSFAISRGENPLRSRPRLPPRLRLRQALARLEARRRVESEEELMFAARAPSVP